MIQQTEYVAVGASSVRTFNNDVPSGADTTSGYYITYIMAPEDEGGGFTGVSWYFGELGNPLNAAGLSSYEEVRRRYDENRGNLNDVFSSWTTNSSDDAIHYFASDLLWNKARQCISYA